MGLINCPECNNQVSDMANACPHCGFPLRRPQNSNQNIGIVQQPSNQSTNQSIFLPPTGQTVQHHQQTNNGASRNTATKVCKYCHTTINKKAVNCPICHKKVGTDTKGLILFALLSLICLVFISNFLRIASEPISNTTAETFTQIENVNTYSLMSVDDLKKLLGEPVAEGTWTNYTSHGEVELTTLEYDINSNHYEFVIGDGTVVRLSIYSNQWWNRNGELFSYSSDDKDEILRMFGVIPDGSANLVCDNNFTYRYTPANELIKDFNVQEIDSTNKTFGLVKVTYNQSYFN